MCALSTARFTEDDTTNSTLLIVKNSHLTTPLTTGVGHHFIKHVANYKYLANLLQAMLTATCDTWVCILPFDSCFFLLHLNKRLDMPYIHVVTCMQLSS